MDENENKKNNLFRNFSDSLGDNPNQNQPEENNIHKDPTVDEVINDKIEKKDVVNKRHTNELSEADVEEAKKKYSPQAITELYPEEVRLTGTLFEYQKELDETGSPVRELDESTGKYHDKLFVNSKNQYVVEKEIKWDNEIKLDIKRGLETYDAFRTNFEQRQSYSTQTLIDDAGINKLYDKIVAESLDANGVSDIEIVQYEHFGLVRYSKGPNDWFNQRLLYKSAVDPLITLIKHKAGMKIERRNSKKPQTNGQLVYADINFRLATGSNQYGMFIVMRRQGSHFNSLDELDFPDLIKSEFRKAIAGKDGLTIVGGPVGSGKTTLMTTGLVERLEQTNGSQNIISLEKPIETPTPGIIQQEIDDYDMTWSNGIQSALREMPTILRVGEVNEKPAAQAIVRGANSGVVALTTMHIRSTLEVFETLKDYDISENEIKNSLRLVIYLNRVHKLCPYCRKVNSILGNPDISNWADKVLNDGKSGTLSEFAVRNKEGCEYCRRNQSKPELYGTLGSVGVYELLKVNKPLLRIWRRYADEDLYVLKDKLLHPDTIRLYNKDAVSEQDKYVKMDESTLTGLLYIPLEKDVLNKLQSFDIDYETAKYLMND